MAFPCDAGFPYENDSPLPLMGRTYSSARNQETEEARHQKLFKKTSMTARLEVKHLVGFCVTYGMRREQGKRPLLALVFIFLSVLLLFSVVSFSLPQPKD